MRKEELQRAFADLKEKTLTVFREMLAAAPNPKTGQYTLDASSNIWQNTKVEVEDLNMVKVLIPYYIRYIDGIDEEGKQWGWARRPWSMVKDLRSYRSWLPPVHPIAEWMRKRLGSANNKDVWKMCNIIATYGIRARPVFDEWEKRMDELMDKWMSDLFDAILSDLDTYFNK